MPINISALGVTKLQGYREVVSAHDIVHCTIPVLKISTLKAFPPVLTLASNQPFFSIEMFEFWVSSSGYELYETWLKNSVDIAQDSARGQELINEVSIKDIKNFRETVRFIF